MTDQTPAAYVGDGGFYPAAFFQLGFEKIQSELFKQTAEVERLREELAWNKKADIKRSQKDEAEIKRINENHDRQWREAQAEIARLQKEKLAPELKELVSAALKTVNAVHAYLAGPVVPDEEVRTWPLYAGSDGVWCGDDDCPLMAESSEIGDFSEGVFTLNELHEALGNHIAARREREAPDG